MVRLTPLLFVAAATAASGVLNLIPSNFDKVVFESNKPALVEFFAPCMFLLSPDTCEKTLTENHRVRSLQKPRPSLR